MYVAPLVRINQPDPDSTAPYPRGQVYASRYPNPLLGRIPTPALYRSPTTYVIDQTGPLRHFQHSWNEDYERDRAWEGRDLGH